MPPFKILVGLSVLCCATSVSAQPRPIAATTLVTTDTSVTSACIGGNTISAPSTCLGGLQAGPVVVNSALTLPAGIPAVTTNKLYSSGGNLFWSGLAVATGGSVGPGTTNTIPLFTAANTIGNSLLTQAGTVVSVAGTVASTVFGANTFTAGGTGDESLTVRNTTAGTTMRGVLFLGNDTSATSGTLATHSSTFTTSGAAIANGVKLTASGVGGLSLQASDATGIIHFFTGTGTTERGQITAAGLFNWTTFGAHLFTAGGTGANSLTVKNTTAGAGNSGQVLALSDTVTTSLVSFSSTFTTAGALVQGGTLFFGDGVGGISIDAAHASGAVRIYTGSATLRATFDSAGNFNLGSTNIMDSPAVPTMASTTGGTSSIAGRVTGFVVSILTGSVTGVVVNLNTTFASVPACAASIGGGTVSTIRSTPTTSQLSLDFSTALAPGAFVSVICRGY